MSEILTAIGFMSGTSADGIDAAVLRTDGEALLEILAGTTFPFTGDERNLILAAYDDAANLQYRDERSKTLLRAEEVVTTRHVEATHAILESLKLAPNQIDVIGFHGQTVFHCPGQGLTVQLGNGDVLAQKTGIDVVYDFRGDDVKAGGEGAPLVPAYHKARIIADGTRLPAVVVNIGGVANVTWIGSQGELLAFDTGPGNGLIDDWMKRVTGQPMDEGGALALSGNVNNAVLEKLMSHPYFNLAPPKSLDRKAFTLDHLNGLSPEDGAATLSAFTAESILASRRYWELEPKHWIICGGGTHNLAIMSALQRSCPGEVHSAAELGWNPDLIEAEAFAYLAVRSLKSKALTFPGTTGVPAPLTGGTLVHARS